jgi:hypothetical protein
VWRDGTKDHYLVGQRFPEPKWRGLVNDGYTARDVAKWGDRQQRLGAAEYLGPKKILQQCRAKLISKTARGNRLYLVPKNPAGNLLIVTYRCPSTDETYHRFVPDRFEDADVAQAWRLSLTPEQYQNLIET